MPRKVVSTLFVSADGYIDEPGKWSFPFWSEEASQFKAKELADSDIQLLGRVTYEGFAAAWPAMNTDAFGEKMNAMPKYVASRTLETATWNATVIKGDVAEEVARLKQEDGGFLVIHGSGTLVDYLTEHNLVDEYRLMVFPIILSAADASLRLFANAPRRNLKLVDSVAFPSGVVLNTYHPAAETAAAQ